LYVSFNIFLEELKEHGLSSNSLELRCEYKVFKGDSLMNRDINSHNKQCNKSRKKETYNMLIMMLFYFRFGVIKKPTNSFMSIFIREIRYTTWLPNLIMVKKVNGKWRICVDYSNLNKTCPKDTFLLPSINLLVDNTIS